MPPIKRNQKPSQTPSTRRLAGHTGPVRPGSGGSAESAPDPVTTPKRKRRGDDDKTGARRTATGRSTVAGDGSSRRRPGKKLAYAMLAVGVAAGAAGGFLATEPGVDVPNQAFVDRAATDEVLTAAISNVQRLVSIDYEALDEYHASLGEFLTPNLVEELDKNWPALRDSYEQSATTVDARVSEAGVAYLEGDRAEVLLVQEVSMEREGVAAGSTTGTYQVGLDKVNGVWKLSRIPDLPS